MGVKPDENAAKWQAFENKLKSMVQLGEEVVVRIAYQTADKSFIPISNFDDLRVIAENYCLSQSGAVFEDSFEVPLAVLVIALDLKALAFRMEQLRLAGRESIEFADLDPAEVRYTSVKRPVPKRMRRQRVLMKKSESSSEKLESLEAVAAVAAAIAAEEEKKEDNDDDVVHHNPDVSEAMMDEKMEPSPHDHHHSSSVDDGFVLASMDDKSAHSLPPDRDKVVVPLDDDSIIDEIAAEKKEEQSVDSSSSMTTAVTTISDEHRSQLRSSAMKEESHDDAKLDSVATIPLQSSLESPILEKEAETDSHSSLLMSSTTKKKKEEKIKQPMSNVVGVVDTTVSPSLISSERPSGVSCSSKSSSSSSSSSRRSSSNMSTVFVSGGPPYLKSSDKMRRLFARFGTITREMYNKQKAKHAFIYKSPDSAQKAFDEMNGRSFEGSTIYVSIHETRRFLATVPPSPALKSAKSQSDEMKGSSAKKEGMPPEKGIPLISPHPPSAVSPQTSTASESSSTSSRVSVTSAEVSQDRVAADVNTAEDSLRDEPGAELKSDDDGGDGGVHQSDANDDPSMQKPEISSDQDGSVGVPAYSSVPPAEVIEAYQRAELSSPIDATKGADYYPPLSSSSKDTAVDSTHIREPMTVVPPLDFERNRSIPAPEYDRPDSSASIATAKAAPSFPSSIAAGMDPVSGMQETSKQMGELQNMMATLMKTVSQSVVSVSTGRTRGTQSVSSDSAMDQQSDDSLDSRDHRRRRHGRRDRRKGHSSRSSHRRRRDRHSSHRPRRSKSRHSGKRSKRRRRHRDDSYSSSSIDSSSDSEIRSSGQGSSSESGSDGHLKSTHSDHHSSDTSIDITDDDGGEPPILQQHNPTPSGSLLFDKKEDIVAKGASAIPVTDPDAAETAIGETPSVTTVSKSKSGRQRRKLGSSSSTTTSTTTSSSKKKRKKHHHQRKHKHRRKRDSGRDEHKKQQQSIDKLCSVVDSLTAAVGDFNRTATQLQSSVMQMSFYNQSVYSAMMSASSAAAGTATTGSAGGLGLSRTPPMIPAMPGTSLASSGHVSGTAATTTTTSSVLVPPPPGPWMSFTPPMDPHGYQQFVQWQRQQQQSFVHSHHPSVTVPVSKSPAHSGSSGGLSGSSGGKIHESPTMSSIIASSEMTRSKLAQLEQLKAKSQASKKSALDSPSLAPLTASPVMVSVKPGTEVERHSRISGESGASRSATVASSSHSSSSVAVPEMEHKLRVLAEHGFTNEMFNKILLKQHNGDLAKVFEDLSKLPTKGDTRKSIT